MDEEQGKRVWRGSSAAALERLSVRADQARGGEGDVRGSGGFRLKKVGLSYVD